MNFPKPQTVNFLRPVRTGKGVLTIGVVAVIFLALTLSACSAGSPPSSVATTPPSSPTSDATPQTSPVAVAQASPTATPTSSPTASPTPTSSPTPTPIPTPTPTPVPTPPKPATPPKPDEMPTDVNKVIYNNELGHWVGLDEAGNIKKIYMEGFDINFVDDVRKKGEWANVMDTTTIEINGVETPIYLTGFDFDEKLVIMMFSDHNDEFLFHNIGFSDNISPLHHEGILQAYWDGQDHYTNTTFQDRLARAFEVAYENRNEEFAGWQPGQPIIITYVPVGDMSRECMKKDIVMGSVAQVHGGRLEMIFATPSESKNGFFTLIQLAATLSNMTNLPQTKNISAEIANPLFGLNQEGMHFIFSTDSKYE